MAEKSVRAAVVQMDVILGDLAGNHARVLERLEEAAENGAEFIVFPECANSGYCFDSIEEALPFAESADGAALARFNQRCGELGVTGILGFLERDGDEVYNSAALSVPGKPLAVYRKTHLPTLGIDRFVSKGAGLPTFEAPFGKVGILICYDVRFPEAARSVGLNGADVIAVPTNWPVGAESAPEFITRSRAWESRAYLTAANRVGVERGRRFIGRSQIASPGGEILCEAGGVEETILYADLDLSQARQKAIVHEPGEWELDITNDRRPELYGALTR